MALDVTDSDFKKEVLECDRLVLVDFWAPWCMPCQMLGPVIEQVAAGMGERLKVCKVNVDDCKDTASQYNIMSIPAVYLFKDGKVVEELIGLRQKQEYDQAIEKHLA